MRSILREQRRSSILAAAITILFGMLLVFWPNQSVGIMCRLLGIAAAVTGVVYVLGWFTRRRMGAPVYLMLPGIVLLALGLWLITLPESVVLLVQYIFGAILLLHGLVDLQSAVVLMRYQAERWWLDMVLTLLTAALGLLILFNPFGTFSALAMLIGVSLIFDGASDLYLIWRLTNAMKDFDDNDTW